LEGRRQRRPRTGLRRVRARTAREKTFSVRGTFSRGRALGVSEKRAPERRGEKNCFSGRRRSFALAGDKMIAHERTQKDWWEDRRQREERVQILAQSLDIGS